ncbi:MAG: M56 family metallopeptidase [Pirellulales bacterium]
MQSFWEIVASNALLVLVLGVGVALLGRIWKNPLYLHLLWVLVLLKLVTPPLVAVPLPLSAMQSRIASEEQVVNARVAHRSPAGAFQEDAPSTAPHQANKHLPDDRAAHETPVPDVHAALLAEHRWIPWPSILGWMWGAGCLLCAVGYAYRILRFRNLLHVSDGPSPALLNMAEKIAKRLGLVRIPEIRMLPVCVSPLVWSLGVRPRVFLPAALFERLDSPAQEAILGHELAHVQRKDHWVRQLEVAMTTLFWWHPVVWWAARRLQELEDQCCDAMVVDLAPHGAKSYAAALLDTMDFLAERALGPPLGATAATSSISMARRIAMLKNRSWTARFTSGRLVFLLTVVALPMAMAVAAAPTDEKTQSPSDVRQDRKPDKASAVETRTIHRLVKDFPQKLDLSTPESAATALHRAFANPDPRAWLDLSAWKYSPRDVADITRKMESQKDEFAKTGEAYGNAEIIEVLTYRDGLAEVISKLNFSGPSRNPYSARTVVRIDGVWKNFGENRPASLEEARKDFERIKDNLWADYLKVLDGIAKGKLVRLEAGDLSSSRSKRSAPIAPGEPLGISVEKADLMGRVEWAMMHGARDITARKTIEWSDVEKDADGNRKIRYKFYATIWGKDVYVMNKMFTFDAKGNILDMEDVEGFPQKEVETPVNVGTQGGMKELVEDFFSKNFRDITSREGEKGEKRGQVRKGGQEPIVK